MELVTLPMSTLVAMHNLLAPQPTATMKTFSQRSKAADRIQKLADAAGVDLDSRFNPDGTLRTIAEAVETINPTVVDSLVMVEKTDFAPGVVETPVEPPAVKEKPAKVEKPAKGPSIRSVAEERLLAVVEVKDGRNVGIPYTEILATIKEQFPGAKTTVACLRWYAVHMRERDIRVTNRPRATPTAPEKEEQNG